MAFYAAEWGFLNHDVSGPKLDGFIGAYMKKKGFNSSVFNYMFSTMRLKFMCQDWLINMLYWK